MSGAGADELVPVRHAVERAFLAWFFVLMPALYVLRLGVQYAQTGDLPYALLDRVKIASELAVLIVLALANECLAAIGPTIASLFSNGVVSGSADAEPAEIQATCERTLDRLLNHPARILPAAGIALGTLYYYVERLDGVTIPAASQPFLNVLDVLLYFVPTVCYAYFVGIVVWKLFATSLFFQFFPDRYVVVPRFLHPDGACGFLPLGDLCLRIMYVAVIPTVLSGLFLLAYFAPQGIAGYLYPNETLLFGFTPLILGVGAIGLVIGFLPLFKFHLTIIKHKDGWTRELRALAERIIAEKAKILRPPDDLGAVPIDAVLQTISRLQSHYEASQKVRMWPVDGGLVARIWASVALLSGQLLAFVETVRKISQPS